MARGRQQLEVRSTLRVQPEELTDAQTRRAAKPDEPCVLSVVVPAFNETDNIVVLHERLTNVLGEVGETYEIIFVDDGSTDTTWERIRELAEQDEAVAGISFSRNFGHQSALMAGMDFARGKAVITMDADLQHPPELIPALVEKWRQGADVVNTVRTYPAGTGFFKKATSVLFYWVMNKLSDTELLPNSADFRLMDRKAVDALCGLRERTLFLRGLTQWIGFSRAEVPFEAAERHAGHTKYSLRKVLRFAVSGITSFSSLPLRAVLLLGLGLLFLAALCGIYLAWSAFLGGNEVSGWSWAMWLVLLATSVQVMILGVIGEYIARIYEETKHRPLYVAKETCGRENGYGLPQEFNAAAAGLSQE